MTFSKEHQLACVGIATSFYDLYLVKTTLIRILKTKNVTKLTNGYEIEATGFQ